MLIFEHLFKVIAPHDCLLCGAEGRLICNACAPSSFTALPERCYRCYKLSMDCKTCQVCRHHSVLKNVWVRTAYDQPARQLIHALKFTHAKPAAVIIAAEINKILPRLDPNTIISHVPAATSHVRARGFDQSALIARELSKLTGLRHINTLARIGQQRQVGSTRQVRLRQVGHAFRPISVSIIQGSHILLVDDVLTTGATVESAALTLKTAGARVTMAAVLASAR